MSKQSRLIARRGVRHFWYVLVGALALICWSTPALAAQPVTGTFAGRGTGREVAFSHQGKSHNDWAGVLKFKLDNGPDVAVFCIQINVRVSSGDRYRSDGPVLALPNGCQIRYLLDKYPASTAQDADEAAARQMAIWVFSDNVDPATIQDAKVRDRAIVLVNEAKAGQCPGRRTAAPTLSLEPPTANATAGSTVQYTVRAGPEDAGQPVTVSVTDPAVLSDANGVSIGQQQQNLALDAQGAASFWVTGTGAGQSTVSVALPYRLEAGTVFSHLDSGKPTQRLVMAESRDLVANASAQVSWAASAPPPQPSAVPTAPPPTPTRRPPRPSQPTETPAPEQPTEAVEQPTESAEQPTESVISDEQATATAVAAEQAGEAPSPTADANAPAPPAGPQDTSEQAAGAAPSAGGAAPQRPRSLPNTGEPGDQAPWLILVVVALLLGGGWVARRRAMR